MNASQELLEHIEDRKVKYVQITLEDYGREPLAVAGSLSEVLPALNVNYNSGYGSQHLFGTIWYEDGTWSDRGEYDGSEWWEHRECPPLPQPQ